MYLYSIYSSTSTLQYSTLWYSTTTTTTGSAVVVATLVVATSSSTSSEYCTSTGMDVVRRSGTRRRASHANKLQLLI